MKYNSKLLATLAAIVFLMHTSSSFATPDDTTDANEPPWIKCASIERSKQLECYEQATQRYLADKQKSESGLPEVAIQEPGKNVSTNNADTHNWKLDHLWPVGGEEFSKSKALAGVLMQYRRNYLLIDSVHSPADTPTSANPRNVVTTSDALDSSEVKLQVSLKAPLPITWPWGDTAWIAYTQQSHWQAFNDADSRPFRETNYEPELIYLSHRFSNTVPTLGNLTPRLLNLSFVHQSNGQTLPRSRSWNRLTAELGSEYRFDADDERRFTVMVRPWWRTSDSNNDDNPDIEDYMGHGDITFDYWNDRDQYSLLLRERAVQLDWSFPLWIKAPNSPNLHLQYFYGYGHSLIDYNHKLHSVGLGISLPY